MTVRIISLMRLTCFGGLAALLGATSPTATLALAAAPAQPPASPALAVPTIKILAIGRWAARATPNAWCPILPARPNQPASLSFNRAIKIASRPTVYLAKGV